MTQPETSTPTASPSPITKGKKRAPPEVPTPIELVDLGVGVERPLAFVADDEDTGATVILSPAGDAFDLWVRAPGKGAIGVSVSPALVLRLAAWIVLTWWAGVALCGLRTYIALRRARRAAMRAEA